MMRTAVSALAFLVGSACAIAGDAPLATDQQIAAAEAATLHPFAAQGHWNDPTAPFKIIGNVYYVGTAHVGSYLITSPKGHFLIDGVLPQTPPQIIANIRALGFDIRDVKYLLSSHAHFDHAGGLAGLQRASGATMVASAGDKDVLEAGQVTYGPSAGIASPPVRVDRVVGDGDHVTLGDVTMTANLTPGHTPGCTSWSVETTGDDGAHHDVIFHCSSTVAGQSLVPESYPGMIGAYRETFKRVRALRADVFLAAHAEFFDMAGKRARQIAGDANAFVDPDALQRFNDAMERQFEAQLAKEQKAAK
jgi:metallo-beta-lactamase class B